MIMINNPRDLKMMIHFIHKIQNVSEAEDATYPMST